MSPECHPVDQSCHLTGGALVQPFDDVRITVEGDLRAGVTQPGDAAADADKPNPNKRISPTEEFLLQRLGPPRKVEGKRKR